MKGFLRDLGEILIVSPVFFVSAVLLYGMAEFLAGYPAVLGVHTPGEVFFSGFLAGVITLPLFFAGQALRCFVKGLEARDEARREEARRKAKKEFDRQVLEELGRSNERIDRLFREEVKALREGR